jgi:uncharacterized protein
MPSLPIKTTFLNCIVHIPPEYATDFVGWQTNLHQSLTFAKGFLSLEISLVDSKGIWKIALRFEQLEHSINWQESDDYKLLFKQLETLLEKGSSPLITDENSLLSSSPATNVSELFVVSIQPNKEQEFRTWLAKIHQIEANFPGFRGVYVQAPVSSDGNSKHWITFLQFDSQKSLDRWLLSLERKEMIHQSKPLIATLENHRVISSYPGWFRTFGMPSEIAPPLWKQAMLVLLVLFPIVLLENLFLNPWLTGLNSSLAMFIGNFISVALLTWPLMPLVIYVMKWWLIPKEGQNGFWITLKGTILVGFLYFLEISFFW